MTTKLSKAEKEAYLVILKKHQKKHPGCGLNERVCKAKLAKDCIGKGAISEFHATASKCKRCLVIVNSNYYKAHVDIKKVKFKKGTKSG